jgi:hypothetical protein
MQPCNPLGLQHATGTKEIKQLFDSIAERGVTSLEHEMRPSAIAGGQGVTAHTSREKFIQFIKITLA